MNDSKLRDQTALIIGGTGGIGKKITELFLHDGCKVAISSSKVGNVRKTVKDFNSKYKDSIVGYACDITNLEALKVMVEKVIKKYTKIDILIISAGIYLTYGAFEYYTLDELPDIVRPIMNTNLIGTINAIATVLPYMIEQNYGRIITFSGGGVDIPLEDMAIYAASKGGIVTFSKCLAKELKKKNYNIKINVFNPGLLNTNFFSDLIYVGDERTQELLKKGFDFAFKYVAGDLEKTCKRIYPYILPKCKKSGKKIRGFKLIKFIKGFIKENKELKEFENCMEPSEI